MGDTRDAQSKSPPGADEGYHKPQRTTAALAVQGTRVGPEGRDNLLRWVIHDPAVEADRHVAAVS